MNYHHVLIVDDSIIERKLINRKLHQLGVSDIKLATNGSEAVKYYKDKYIINPFTLVLMDLDMPIKNGIDTTNEIIEFDSLAIIIGITGNTSNKSLLKFKNAGLLYLFHKPITKKMLQKIL